jgi:hypothetical protein
MRGFVAGFLLLAITISGVLSLRPGGMRNQLRNIARRLRLALLMAGIYLASSVVLRLAFPASLIAEVGMVAVGVVAAVAFILLSPDRPLGPPPKRSTGRDRS